MAKLHERIEYKLLSLTYRKFLQPASLTTCAILSLFSVQVEIALHLLSPLLKHLYLRHYKSLGSGDL